MRVLPLIAIAGLLLSSCAQKRTPEEAIRIAYSYTELQWLPEVRHIRHGTDSAGIMVHTPDTSLVAQGDRRGWWEPGVPAKGMAYKWGGFDSPESFLQGLRDGKKAGDIANSHKIRNDNTAISHESVGIDCSGFISRCWGLAKPVSTRDLPSICNPIPWDDLLPGDILLKQGHVFMFAARSGDHVVGYEAGPIPMWNAHRCAIRIQYLKEEGYSPWRYRHMAKPNPAAAEPRYEIDSRTRWTDRDF